eukprot:1141580-Pelagomonas_calceolata.AAC.4
MRTCREAGAAADAGLAGRDTARTLGTVLDTAGITGTVLDQQVQQAQVKDNKNVETFNERSGLQSVAQDASTA